MQEFALMYIEMFSLSNGYGFCHSKELGKVFFRVENFKKLSSEEPQPILGEVVKVLEVTKTLNKPKSFHVERVKPPKLEYGRVRSFDSSKGWGFAENQQGTYFIHKSDFSEEFTPVIGTYISFYAGKKQNRKRACYILKGKVE